MSEPVIGRRDPESETGCRVTAVATRSTILSPRTDEDRLTTQPRWDESGGDVDTQIRSSANTAYAGTTMYRHTQLMPLVVNSRFSRLLALLRYARGVGRVLETDD